MTREEATAILEDEAYILYEDDSPYNRQAFDMAIEALEERKGKWIVDDEYIDCSYCRREKWSRVPYEQLVSRFRFCPNCGAKMEVKDERSD